MFTFGSNNKNARQRQIKSLEQVPSIRCIESHKEYRVTVNTRLGDRTLYVSLPESFPMVPPRLRIDSNLQHMFADESGNIQNMHELKYWSQASDVGRLVSSIISSFQSNPPIVKPIYSNAYGSSNPYAMNQVQPINNFAEKKDRPPPSYDRSVSFFQQQPQPEPMLDLDSITISPPKDIWDIPSVKKLTETDMKRLLSDERSMREFAIEAAAGIRDMKNSSREGLISTAKSNLKKKEEIVTIENEIRKLRNEVNQLVQKFTSLREEQQKLLQAYAPPRLMQEFDIALSKVDDQCEELKKKFQDKDITETQFVRGYTELRGLYHLLGAKKEKFAALYIS